MKPVPYQVKGILDHLNSGTTGYSTLMTLPLMEVRPTDDIDLTINIVNLGQWEKLQEDLMKGFIQ